MNGSFKVYALNSISLFMTMTNMETALKVLLLVVSIGYTLNRWWMLNKETKETIKQE